MTMMAMSDNCDAYGDDDHDDGVHVAAAFDNIFSKIFPAIVAVTVFVLLFETKSSSQV